jgi:hypothetical protein
MDTSVAPFTEPLFYLCLAGSHLYGTAGAESDVDHRGIYLEPVPSLIGLGSEVGTYRHAGHTTDGTVLDLELHPLRKWVRLALACNPNMLEALFAPRTHWLYSTPAWERIYALRHGFLNVRARFAFTGMARDHLLRVKNPTNRTSKEKRTPLIERYGYDVKDAGHVVRLLLKARPLITAGEMDPVLHGSDRAIVRAVRSGEWPYDELIAWADAQLAELDALTTVLPETPNTPAIEEALLDAMAEHIDRQFRMVV